MRTFFAALFLFLVHACGMTVQQYELTILGNDNRVNINAKTWPWSAVGRLNARFADQSQSFCTATLVGRATIITASHCIHKNGQRAEELTFLTEYSYGSFGEKATVIREWSGSAAPQNNWSKDWALLQIDKDLGSVYGVLRFLQEGTQPELVDLPGYAQRPHEPAMMSAHLGCRIHTQFAGPGKNQGPFPEMAGTIGHDCDLQPGTSGAPLITWVDEQPYIAAIQSYHWQTADGRRGNGAVPLLRLAETLKLFEGEEQNPSTDGV